MVRGPAMMHMPARHVEEARHIGDILPAFVALPGQPAVQPELAAHSDGTHGTNVRQIALLRRCSVVLPQP